MADPTLVNGQVTDSVTQTNVKILADAPGQALGTLYQIMAQTVGAGIQNASAAQQNMTSLSQAATTQGINLLFSMDPAAAAVSTQEILSGNSLAQSLAELQAALGAGLQGSVTAGNTPVVPTPPAPPQPPASPVGAGQAPFAPAT